MNKRLNITLPEQTIRLMDQTSPKGQRSNLIARAIKYYVQNQKRTELRKLLAEGARVRAKRDLKIAEEWFPLEEEAWGLENR